MADQLITGATASDALVCNVADPPKLGVHVGGGLHVIIPPDWSGRILSGLAVPGCSYASVQGGSLVVTDAVQAFVGAHPTPPPGVDATSYSALKNKASLDSNGAIIVGGTSLLQVDDVTARIKVGKWP